MTTLSSASLALAMISAFILALGGGKLMLSPQTRGRGGLMLTAAAVLVANVLIWTL